MNYVLDKFGDVKNVWTRSDRIRQDSARLKMLVLTGLLRFGHIQRRLDVLEHVSTSFFWQVSKGIYKSKYSAASLHSNAHTTYVNNSHATALNGFRQAARYELQKFRKNVSSLITHGNTQMQNIMKIKTNCSEAKF